MPERANLAAFSAPYFSAGLGLAVRRDSAITTVADLDELPVGVQQGTTGEIFVREQTTAVPRTFRDINDAFTALDTGEIAAVIHDQIILLGLLQARPELNAAVRDTLLTDELYGIAVRRDRADLLQTINDGLAQIVNSGAYANLCADWLGTTDACLPSQTILAYLNGTVTALPAAETPLNPAAGHSVTVSILYGSEKQEWLEPLVDSYNAQQRQSPDGSLIQIAATPIGSIEAATAIISGATTATIWAPASSIYLPAVEEAWQAQTGGPLTAVPPQSLVRSPVVLAMWQPMAKALGWPDTPIGWHTIHELVGQDWADLGYVAGGAFKFGHTHPEYSNSGLAAVLAQAYAATGKREGLNTADLADPALRAFVSRIESSIIDYGSSTGFYAERMFNCENGGPTFLSAAVLYENLVAAQPRNCPNHPPLVAIYPDDGTFWTDHPYVVLNAPWVSDTQQWGALDFQSFLLEPTQQGLAMDYGFRPADPSVPLRAPLETANGVDPLQPTVVMEPPETAIVQNIQQLWQETKKAADIVVVMDISGSMWAEEAPGQGAKITAAQAALKTFVDMLKDGDRLQIIAFNANLNNLSPLSPLGEKRAEVQTQIDAIQPDGPTRLYDAVLQAHNELNANGDPNRIRAIVVLSDGRDERIAADGTVSQASVNGLEDVITAVRAGEEGGNAIRIFTIAYGQEADETVLQQIAIVTGGRTLTADANSLHAIYELIAQFF